MLKKFRRNRKGTAEVIGSVMFIVIMIFFFSSVYLWHDQATSQMNTVLSNKMNSPVSIAATDGGLIITDNGGMAITLSRLWIDNSTYHIYADLENVDGNQISVEAGASVSLALASSTEYDGPSIEVTYGNPVTVDYAPIPTEPVTFKILTTLGNTASCSYPATTGDSGSGGNGAIGSVTIADFQSFCYYSITDSESRNPTYTLDSSAGSSAYSVNSNSGNIAFGVTLINSDPMERTISLNANSQLLFIGPSNPTKVGYMIFYIVSTTQSGNIDTITPTYNNITLPYNQPVTIFFAAYQAMTGSTPFSAEAPTNTGTFALNLALLGTIGSNPYGQNIPFVSIIIN